MPNHLALPYIMNDLLKRALSASRESKYIEFKQAFDVTSQRDWCEIIKDIVAMANTGGGVILIGVDSRGTPNGFDVQPLLRLDTADVTNKLFRYTDLHFADFEISERIKNRTSIAVLQVQGVPIPVVFTKPGTYDIGGGKQKNAFSIGTVYFRHGAKSEPGSTEDIRRVIDRQLESIRKDWIRGVRKVVAAPQNSQLVVLPPHATIQDLPHTARVRVVDDLNAPAVRLTRADNLGVSTFVHEEL
jgi:hypothetical protein